MSEKLTIVCGGPGAASPKLRCFKLGVQIAITQTLFVNAALKSTLAIGDLAMRFQRRAAHGPRPHPLSLTVTAVAIAIATCLGGMRTPVVQAAATYQAQITSELVFSGVGFTVLVDPGVSLPDPFVFPLDRAGTFAERSATVTPGAMLLDAFAEAHGQAAGGGGATVQSAASAGGSMWVVNSGQEPVSAHLAVVWDYFIAGAADDLLLESGFSGVALFLAGLGAGPILDFSDFSGLNGTRQGHREDAFDFSIRPGEHRLLVNTAAFGNAASFVPQTIPEPMSLILLIIGFGALILISGARRRAAAARR